MTLGKVFLEATTTGVVIEKEMIRLAHNQGCFSTALLLGQLIDTGMSNLTYLISSRLLQHKQIANDWIRPLGPR